MNKTYTQKDATGKNHKVAIRSEQAEYDGSPARGFTRLIADIDGGWSAGGNSIGIALVSNERVGHEICSLERDVEFFLEAHHHPTHYTGSLAHLAEVSRSLRNWWM